MNNKYKIKYIKYKRKYNNLKIKQKLIGGLPDLLIGTLSALPITSTLSIYSLINTNENYKNKINYLIQLERENSDLASKVIEKFK